MKYKTGTLEEYFIENPMIETEEGSVLSGVKKWKNPKKENEYLWESLLGTIEEDEKFDIVSVWTNSIIKPTSIKYYINKNGHYTAGIVEPGRVMQSGLKNLELYNDKQQWIDRATEVGAEIGDLES